MHCNLHILNLCVFLILQEDNLRSAGKEVEADPQQEEQVLRVQGAVQASAVP